MFSIYLALIRLLYYLYFGAIVKLKQNKMSKNTRKFLVSWRFQDVIKWEQWLLVVVNNSFKINPSLDSFPILYPLKTQDNESFSGVTKQEHWPEMDKRGVLENHRSSLYRNYMQHRDFPCYI